jgi:predicted Co/Zn/Cd cation transporter (cation efflux family)
LGVLGCHAAFLVPTIHHNNNNNNNYELNKKLSSSSNGLIAGGVIMALVTATLQVLGGVVGGSMVIIHAFQGVYYTPIVVVLVLAILNIGLVNLRRMASRLARNNNSSTGGRKDKGA